MKKQTKGFTIRYTGIIVNITGAGITDFSAKDSKYIADCVANGWKKGVYDLVDDKGNEKGVQIKWVAKKTKPQTPVSNIGKTYKHYSAQETAKEIGLISAVISDTIAKQLYDELRLGYMATIDIISNLAIEFFNINLNTEFNGGDIIWDDEAIKFASLKLKILSEGIHTIDKYQLHFEIQNNALAPRNEVLIAENYLSDGELTTEQMIEAIRNHPDGSDMIDNVGGVVVWQKVEDTFTCDEFIDLIERS